MAKGLRRIGGLAGATRSGSPAAVLGVALALALTVSACTHPEVGGPWTQPTAPPGGVPYPGETLPEDVTPSVPGGGPNLVDVGTEVVNAYRNAVVAANEAYANPAEGTSLLIDLYAEPELGRLDAALSGLRDQGAKVSYPHGIPPVTQILSVDVNDATAMLRVCRVDNALQVDAATGDVRNDDKVSSLRSVTLASFQGGWKVSSDDVIQEWPDTNGCDR